MRPSEVAGIYGRMQVVLELPTMSVWNTVLDTMSFLKPKPAPRKRGKYLKMAIYAHCYGHVGKSRIGFNKLSKDKGYISRRRVKKFIKLYV